MANQNEDIASNSVPLSITNGSHCVPFRVPLGPFGDNTVNHDDDEHPHEWEDNIRVLCVVNEPVVVSMESPEAGSEVEDPNEGAANSVNPEEVAPHETVDMSIHDNHD